MESKSSLVQMNCMLRVDTQSPGWEKSLSKVIKRVKDVCYSIDVASGIVSISGEIDPNKLLSEIKKAGKHAELIRADCGVANSQPNYGNVYAYDDGIIYNNGQIMAEPHSHTATTTNPYSSSSYYYYVSSQPAAAGRGCIEIQYDDDPHNHHQFSRLSLPAPTPHHVMSPPSPLCPTPTAPPVQNDDGDPYSSACIIS